MIDNLYIQVSGDTTIDHPILESNLKLFFPDLDPFNPPEGIARFITTNPPELKSYEVIEKITYEVHERYTELYGTKVFTQVYHIVNIQDMDYENKKELIDKYVEMHPELSDWILDKETDHLVPPIPKPNDGKEYFWQFPKPEEGIIEGSWVEDTEKTKLNEQEYAMMIQAMQELTAEINNVSEEEAEEILKNMTKEV